MKDMKYNFLGGNYFLQESFDITNLHKEYRLIQTNCGEVIFAYERKRNIENNGVDDTLINHHVENILYEIPDVIKNEIKIIFEKLNIFTSSIDLMIDKNGKYSIIETSIEFSLLDLSNTDKSMVLDKIMCSMIKSYINKLHI